MTRVAPPINTDCWGCPSDLMSTSPALSTKHPAIPSIVSPLSHHPFPITSPLTIPPAPAPSQIPPAFPALHTPTKPTKQKSKPNTKSKHVLLLQNSCLFTAKCEDLKSRK